MEDNWLVSYANNGFVLTDFSCSQGQLTGENCLRVFGILED